MNEDTRVCVNCLQRRQLSMFEVKANGKRKAWCDECRRLLRNTNARKKRALRQNGVHHENGKSYVSRNEWLGLLGFRSYRDYLQSDLWRSIRKRVYQQKGSLCWLCKDHATELHHNRYHKNDLLGTKTRFIFPLCRSCHEGIEFSSGQKNDVHQAAKEFKRRLKKLRSSK